MGPLAADHPMLRGDFCKACDAFFKEGDFVTLVPLGPGDDEENRRKARENRPYNAVAAVVHWACATGEIE